MMANTPAMAPNTAPTCGIVILARDEHPLTDANVSLPGVLLKVILDAGLKKRQFGSELLRLGEEQMGGTYKVLVQVDVAKASRPESLLHLPGATQLALFECSPLHVVPRLPASCMSYVFISSFKDLRATRPCAKVSHPSIVTIKEEEIHKYLEKGEVKPQVEMNLFVIIAIFAAFSVDASFSRRSSKKSGSPKPSRPKSEMCQSEDGSTYRGSVSESAYGRRCLNWNRFHVPSGASKGLGDHNYCRFHTNNETPIGCGYRGTLVVRWCVKRQMSIV
ncbi:hypothetical protein EYF80_031438 [Liparis tanakae]|uniref:Kringle domain-containing protein n=1 Tax=Liparis tanakae TaxID=230148 RepID=A0A4Z2GXS2_9TELE|nr:hypothetical protein EYF80_031438 [Liparis tanakae]